MSSCSDDLMLDYIVKSRNDNPDDMLMKALDRSGLVQKDVQVTGRNGQQFTRKQWVKANNDNVSNNSVNTSQHEHKSGSKIASMDSDKVTYNVEQLKKMPVGAIISTKDSKGNFNVYEHQGNGTWSTTNVTGDKLYKQSGTDVDRLIRNSKDDFVKTPKNIADRVKERAIHNPVLKTEPKVMDLANDSDTSASGKFKPLDFGLRGGGEGLAEFMNSIAENHKVDSIQNGAAGFGTVKIDGNSIGFGIETNGKPYIITNGKKMNNMEEVNKYFGKGTQSDSGKTQEHTSSNSASQYNDMSQDELKKELEIENNKLKTAQDIVNKTSEDIAQIKESKNRIATIRSSIDKVSISPDPKKIYSAKVGGIDRKVTDVVYIKDRDVYSYREIGNDGKAGKAYHNMSANEWSTAKVDEPDSKDSKTDSSSTDSNTGASDKKPNTVEDYFSGNHSHDSGKAALAGLLGKGHTREDIISQAEKSGVTWKKSEHTGINWMRASMAIQKHLGNSKVKD